MDLLQRVLRDGTPSKAALANFVLVSSHLEVPGTLNIVAHALARAAEACGQGRGQAARVLCVCVDEGPDELRALIPDGSARTVAFLDAYRDAAGWLRDAPGPEGCPGVLSPGGLDRLMRCIAEHPLAQRARDAAGTLASGSEPCRPLIVVIYSLSSLAVVHGAPAAVTFARSLRAAPGVSSVVAVVHGDAHSAGDRAALTSGAAAAAAMVPASALQCDLAEAKEGWRPVGSLRTWAVRVRAWGGAAQRASTQLFGLGGGGSAVGGVRFVEAPRAQGGAKDLAAAALKGELGPGARDGGAGGAAPAQDAVEELSRLSGMDLRVTEEQQRAREQVVLPYEHRGQSARYATTAFEEYLPPAAGGRGAGRPVEGVGSGKLGHILYVRDSESEHDSDEDPDDDLDI